MAKLKRRNKKVTDFKKKLEQKRLAVSEFILKNPVEEIVRKARKEKWAKETLELGIMIKIAQALKTRNLKERI